MENKDIKIYITIDNFSPVIKKLTQINNPKLNLLYHTTQNEEKIVTLQILFKSFNITNINKFLHSFLSISINPKQFLEVDN